MSSVADGDMKDPLLKDCIVDKNGYAVSEPKAVPSYSLYPTHTSALFSRRECIVDIDGASVVVPEELPAGVQLRVSSIVLLHSVICGYTNAFFDAENSSPVGESFAVKLGYIILFLLTFIFAFLYPNF